MTGAQTVMANQELSGFLKPKEKLWSPSLSEFTLTLVQKSSLGITCDVIEKSTGITVPKTTLDARVKSTATKARSMLNSQVESHLKSLDIDLDNTEQNQKAANGKPDNELNIKRCATPAALFEAVSTCNDDIDELKQSILNFDPQLDWLANSLSLPDELFCFDYEASPGDAVIVCIDDVLVKKQKEHRNCYAPSRNNGARPSISTTNMVVQVDGKEITMTGSSNKEVISQLIVFLDKTKAASDRKLIVFADGARSIKEDLKTYLAPFHSYKLYLDWKHFDKRCRALLSQSIIGTKPDKQEFVRILISLAWFGRPDLCVSLLSTHVRNLEVKNQQRLGEWIKYISKHSAEMPVYAIRKQLGLINSSNSVERANARLVAHRQKGNGMSWSKKGSQSYAMLTSITGNGRLSSLLFDNNLNNYYELSLAS